MNLAIPNPYGVTASSALDLARDRDLFPTAWGSADIRQLDQALRERAVFSARTTNARYIQSLKDRIERYLEGGYKGDLATLRVELRQELARVGYHPERGFPGDAALDIPPARPGSLQDLSSERRLNLILNTQLALMTGRAQRIAALDPMALAMYPAFELVRTQSRRLQRNWPLRWVQAGGTLSGPNKNRMVALKTDPIWQALGSSDLFPDALDVDHPPFAFESGMGWNQIDEFEAIDLGILSDPATATASTPVPAQTPPPPPTIDDVIPPMIAPNDGLDLGIIARIKKTLGGLITAGKGLLWRWTKGRAEINATPPPTDILTHLVTLAAAIPARSDHVH